ncbi:glycosyltransferase [bacterium]|nr:glycosyltransferase [bacterium]
MKSDKKPLRVAIVSDAIDARGGVEKVILSLLKAFPNATIYTVRSNRKYTKVEFPGVKIRNSFIQYIPFEKLLRRELYLLYPWAYRSFSFFGYDVVISVSSSFAKFIKPWRKQTKHIGYIQTPPRFFWMHDIRTIKGMSRFSFKFYSFFVSTFLEKLWQKWDRNAARKIDKVVVISKEVQRRVKKFYDLDSEVIYSPVEVKEMKFNKDMGKRENWFLYFGRVETYKGVELAIRAAVLAHKPIKIAGTGQDMDRMQELVTELNAKGTVKFLGYVSDELKLELFSKCKALLFPVQDEDFGIVPVEANASGGPVIAYRSGGVLESISEDNPKTGVFFDEYTPEALAEILKTFDPREFNPANCRKQASNFASEIFEYKMKNLVKEVADNGK